MKAITQAAWEEVHQKACDIANAATADDDVMIEVHKARMFEILDRLEVEFGIHPQTLSTRADYSEDDQERRQLYEAALLLAREQGDEFEISEIQESLRGLDQESK
ncbi:hypothetical protein [Haloferula sp. BvORR071]|uniref:hypothetical protein n=1 Tax=Haloferula sp. BvORR071 TaxID=1396141 RepID=UPI0005565E6D|nr:hypothetical protein [Haloferula sp. BvORR071]